MIVYNRALARVIARHQKKSTPYVTKLCGSTSVFSDTTRSIAIDVRNNRMMSSYHSPLYSPTHINYPYPNNYNNSCVSFSSVAEAVDDDDDDEEDLPNKSFTIKRRKGIRNVAIVAHVDHGKTTLVDELLKVAAASSSVTSGDIDGESDINNNNNNAENNINEATLEPDRLMDSGELEKERGITIKSKVTRLNYTCKSTSTEEDSSYIINVVDTPGHADFAGEVDRILSTVDGIVLVVDAGEGPKSQTKYVLSHALSLGLVPIVVLNKADRPESLGRLETGETELELMDLFEALGATGEQMEYKTLFGSARGGWITDDVDVALNVVQTGTNDDVMSMRGLLDSIVANIPPPSVHWYGSNGENSSDAAAAKDVNDFADEPFSMTATTVGYDSYLGRTCTGRIYSGHIEQGGGITLLRRNNDGDDATNNIVGPSSQLNGVFANIGVSRVALDPAFAYAGDIVTLSGVPESMAVGDTLTSTANQVQKAVDTPPLAPPTLSCLFGANNGPLSGMEGTVVASSQVRARVSYYLMICHVIKSALLTIN